MTSIVFHLFPAIYFYLQQKIAIVHLFFAIPETFILLALHQVKISTPTIDVATLQKADSQAGTNHFFDSLISSRKRKKSFFIKS
jgi:hypothetical protein